MGKLHFFWLGLGKNRLEHFLLVLKGGSCKSKKNNYAFYNWLELSSKLNYYYYFIFNNKKAFLIIYCRHSQHFFSTFYYHTYY
jgi:hypothetical protein